MSRLRRTPGPGPFHDDLEDELESITVPRPLLIAAGLLLVLSITAAGVARWTGFGEVTAEAFQVAASVELRFEDQENGAVRILNGEGEVLDVMDPGTNGFARGALRALVRERRLRDIGREEPFELVRTVDGRLLLTDPATDIQVDLRAFGQTQVATFASLLNGS